MWINSCLVKSAFSENALSHFEQVCGFSPEWINSCYFKWFLVWMLCHILSRHLAFCQCGISSYVFKVPFCVNVLSHFEQACGFWPVWITSCFFKCVFCENALSHFEQALKRWKAKWDKNQQKKPYLLQKSLNLLPKKCPLLRESTNKGELLHKKGTKSWSPRNCPLLRGSPLFWSPLLRGTTVILLQAPLD